MVAGSFGLYLFFVGLAMCMAGCAVYLKTKGYSWIAGALLGVLHWLGLVIALLLRERPPADANGTLAPITDEDKEAWRTATYWPRRIGLVISLVGVALVIVACTLSSSPKNDALIVWALILGIAASMAGCIVYARAKGHSWMTGAWLGLLIGPGIVIAALLRERVPVAIPPVPARAVPPWPPGVQAVSGVNGGYSFGMVATSHELLVVHCETPRTEAAYNSFEWLALMAGHVSPAMLFDRSINGPKRRRAWDAFLNHDTVAMVGKGSAHARYPLTSIGRIDLNEAKRTLDMRAGGFVNGRRLRLSYPAEAEEQFREFVACLRQLSGASAT